MRRVLLVVLLSLGLLLKTTHPTQAAGQNFFPYGQCTWFAAQMRPDLLGSVWGDAWDWANEARRAGYRTSSVPAVGAVVVFQPGAQQATWQGHVAYVTAVGGGGFFAVREMHFPWVGRSTQRWAHTGWGVAFILWR